jgi:predicted unusual protein kinase regulating ubiquinone biosynthesis (AarF/ABC1/UbiB family)
LATFFQLVLTLVPGLSRLDVRGMAKEVADRIGEEVDYRVEAANQQEFADLYRGHAFIRIPEVVPEFSRRRVLTMDLSDGIRYAKALSAEQSLRDAWGEAIYRFVWGNLIRRQLFNADPHPGNFLFHPDGSVTCLDFGCVKRFSLPVWQRLEAVTRAAIDQDAARVLEAAIDGGIIARADAPDAQALLAFYSLGVQELIQEQPFRYTPAVAAQILREGATVRGEHWPVVKRVRTDPNYTLLTRNMTSLTSVLGGLNATGPWRAVRAEYDSDAAPSTPFGEAERAHSQEMR